MFPKSDSSVPGVLEPGDSGPAARRALLDWLALQAALGRDAERACGLLSRLRDPAAALRAAPDVSGPARTRLEAWIEALRRSGAVGLPLLSELYPARLARLRDPSPLLWVIGDPAALSLPSVAIVGSRAATAYGLRVARAFAGELARAGLVVVSGLARGIDAAAHRGALEAGGRTVAVQACGPDRVYPAAHRELAARIAERGALVTEMPPGTPPMRHLFGLRNRLISGLAATLLVVEARVRSGTFLTVRHALEQNVDVFAIPGPIDAPASAGPNRLLRDGAHTALEPADLLLRYGLLPAPDRERGRTREKRPAEQAILAALAHEPATRDELGRRLRRPPEQLALALIELEIEGRVVEDRDGRLRAIEVSTPPGRRRS